ncbi:MAG TPA: hypothetical protein PKD24_07155 [Pyrinomonadaceae bacterium]|nr:hypothetical protein [Pyrinomonadaceae bacterium]HMP65063.1 hypothetical protein [Pyrinomonadaceae bacterium]
MTIRDLLFEAHSKEQTVKIVDHIGSDAKRFRELVDIFFAGPYRLTQRAAWPLSVVAEKRPELLRPYLNKLIDQLPKKDVHPAVKRNVVRLLQFVEIPKRLRGKVYSHCLDLIADPKEPIAVKAFSLTVAERIAHTEPALLEELRMVAAPLAKDASPGIKVRLRGILDQSDI